jgi:hypothetical protein
VPKGRLGGVEFLQTWSFRGRKSRNKVSVGEPAEGSLEDRIRGERGVAEQAFVPQHKNGFSKQ